MLEGSMATVDVGGGGDGGRTTDRLWWIVMWHASMALEITEASHSSQEGSRFWTFSPGSISPWTQTSEWISGPMDWRTALWTSDQVQVQTWFSWFKNLTIDSLAHRAALSIWKKLDDVRQAHNNQICQVYHDAVEAWEAECEAAKVIRQKPKLKQGPLEPQMAKPKKVIENEDEDLNEDENSGASW